MKNNKPEMDKRTLNRNVVMSPEMERSEAIKQLGASAIRVLLRFLQKRPWSKVGKSIVYDNRGLAFPYSEALEMGIKNTAVYDAIKRLVEVGFLDVEHQGGAYDKDSSLYAVSERWRDYGTENFKKVEKKRSLPDGMDVRSNMRRKVKTPTEKRSEPLRKNVVHHYGKA